jgi:hypothetical protein
MSSTVATVEALLVVFTALPRVSGKPTFEDISLVLQILNQNAMSIQSYDGGADQGHPRLVVMPIEHIMQVPGDTYTRSYNPGPTLDIPNGATSVDANIMVQEHTELLRA